MCSFYPLKLLTLSLQVTYMGGTLHPMGLREDLQKKIDRKQAEIEQIQRDYHDVMRESNAYLQALQDTLKMIPKDAAAQSDVVLRRGSTVEKARDALKAVGRPLHITELLKAIGQGTDISHRTALAGSLGAYVRDKKIFTRPAPNTFGLIEFDSVMAEINENGEVVI